MKWLKSIKEFFSPPPFKSFAEFGGLTVEEHHDTILPELAQLAVSEILPEPSRAVFSLPPESTGSQIVGTFGLWAIPTTPAMLSFFLGAVGQSPFAITTEGGESILTELGEEILTEAAP